MKIPEIQACPKCRSSKLRFVPEDGEPHHGRILCGACGGFICWASKGLAKFLDRFGGDR